MLRWFRVGVLLATALPAAGIAGPCWAAQRFERYYAHATVEDAQGVIAPWYTGQNGQFDFRVRIAAETLKRYPWTDTARAVAAVPEYFFSGAWKIAENGAISVPPIDDWANGDLGQRASYVLLGLVDYYRYTGDVSALSIVALQADFLLDHCLTPSDHPWPDFLISVPIKGKPYGKASPEGMIQLDIVAEVGLGMLRAYQVMGETRWLEAAEHWGDLLAAHADLAPDRAPWPRYANPESAPWGEDQMTGGIAFILTFLDELIRLGHCGTDGSIVKARDAGRAYLRDVLLPAWTTHDTWGRNYWDWPCFVQVENVTEYAARYLMTHPCEFKNWRNDVRNIMTLFLNRTSVSTQSNSDVFSGAWAYPESSGCCKRSLWYGPMEVSTVFAEYGVRADNAWALELARRQQLLATYDIHEQGIVEDNIDGGAVVAADWFKIAHPMALRHVLGTMAWLPASEGAARENHIMRSSAVVSDVIYGTGRVDFHTFDAPKDTETVLRLAFCPNRITANGKTLKQRGVLEKNGYLLQALPGGDFLITIRHDGKCRVFVEGPDPQREIGPDGMRFSGAWEECASEKDAIAEIAFSGNQVRVFGMFQPDGGLADVYLDGEKQRAPADAWFPHGLREGLFYYRNGLANGPHTLKLVALGQGRPVSRGGKICLSRVQYSSAEGTSVFGAGGGPADAQRLVFGYTGREDLVDAQGNPWRPGTEFLIRLGDTIDTVEAAWWKTRRRHVIFGTDNPELYRYGVHGKKFWVPLTVGPGVYHVRLKFAETRDIEAEKRCIDVAINGKERVNRMDIAATAGGKYTAVDLVFNDMQPEHGIIEVELSNPDGEAILQAIEVGPGPGGSGATPVCLPPKP